MLLNLTRIRYKDLDAREKENYNYQKLAGVLADYGFVTMRLSADWRGADLIAQHIDGDTFLKIQLKGRLTFCEKYVGKEIYIAFPRRGDWYIYPHDELLEKVDSIIGIKTTLSWTEEGIYSFPSLSKKLYQILNKYQIEPRQLKLKMDG
ncbi:MAG TPA: hypothetical protein VKB86_15580 [Pyrinomonadaceae bacterium]|nr:hypothetical protein [Pyrinomonadaceae bacterium]